MTRHEFGTSVSDFTKDKSHADWKNETIKTADIAGLSFSDLDYLYKFWKDVFRSGVFVLTNCSLGGREGVAIDWQIQVAFDNCHQIEKATFFSTIANSNNQRKDQNEYYNQCL
ncbi:MAG: hypothetical protein ACKOS8_14510 [Gemmataceae bacterium]